MKRGNMSDRLTKRFAQLKAQDRTGLVTFITAGDPDHNTAQNILNGLAAAGADIIELGMPFSDPMADGQAIQRSYIRALANGACLKNTLSLVADFRARDQETPIVLMGYYNPIYRYGNQRFLDDATAAGVDGLIIVDLPPEEDDELLQPCISAGINWIRLTTPTSDDARLSTVLRHSSGFVYHVAIAGVTGTGSADIKDVAAAMKRIRAQTDLPIAVGFGIKTAEQIAEIGKIADAAVVGSALVNVIKAGLDGGQSNENIVQALHNLVRDLATGSTGSA